MPEEPDRPEGEEPQEQPQGTAAEGSPEPGETAEPAPSSPQGDGPDIPESVHREAEASVEEEKWPPDEEVSRDARTMALLAWLLGIVSWFIGPLIIYLVKKDESKFIAFHGLQALLFSVVVTIGAVLLALVTCLFGGLGGIPVWVFNVVICILWGIKANNGEWAELPAVGGWVRGIMRDK